MNIPDKITYLLIKDNKALRRNAILAIKLYQLEKVVFLRSLCMSVTFSGPKERLGYLFLEKDQCCMHWFSYGIFYVLKVPLCNLPYSEIIFLLQSMNSFLP